MSVRLILTQGTHRNAKNRWVRSSLGPYAWCRMSFQLLPSLHKTRMDLGMHSFAHKIWKGKLQCWGLTSGASCPWAAQVILTVTNQWLLRCMIWFWKKIMPYDIPPEWMYWKVPVMIEKMVLMWYLDMSYLVAFSGRYIASIQMMLRDKLKQL